MSTTAMPIELTPTLFRRTVADFRGIAKENGAMRWLKGGMYFFGSEVATLRLLAKYRESKDAHQGYSTNLGTHFFCLDMRSLVATEDLECASSEGPQV